MLLLVSFFRASPISPQDVTLDFSIEPTSLAAVATNRCPGNSSTTLKFSTPVRGSDTAAREDFLTPRPQDGTLDFGIAPALPAAVTTRADSDENSSRTASFDAAVRGRDMAALIFFPRLAHTTVHCISIVHLPCPLLWPPVPILLEPTVLLQGLILLSKGARRPLEILVVRPVHKMAP